MPSLQEALLESKLAVKPEEKLKEVEGINEIIAIMNLRTSDTIYIMKSFSLFNTFSYSFNKDKNLAIYISGDNCFLTKSAFQTLKERADFYKKRYEVVETKIKTGLINLTVLQYS